MDFFFSVNGSPPLIIGAYLWHFVTTKFNILFIYLLLVYLTIHGYTCHEKKLHEVVLILSRILDFAYSTHVTASVHIVTYAPRAVKNTYSFCMDKCWACWLPFTIKSSSLRFLTFYSSIWSAKSTYVKNVPYLSTFLCVRNTNQCVFFFAGFPILPSRSLQSCSNEYHLSKYHAYQPPTSPSKFTTTFIGDLSGMLRTYKLLRTVFSFCKF